MNLLYCLTLELCIIIDISVDVPFRDKYSVYGINYRYKHMMKLEMLKLLHTELIRGDPNF